MGSPYILGGNLIMNEYREYWVQIASRISTPVLYSLSRGELHKLLPIGIGTEHRRHSSPLEAFARTITGLAPWFETSEPGEEASVRKQLTNWTSKALDIATNPDSPDYMNFEHGMQKLVDTAFLAHAILRAPNVLYFKLEARVKSQIIRAFKITRKIKPVFNNWLLFSALIEAALFRLGEDGDAMRIDYALRQHDQWYVGDGTYSDGPSFHWDYYNSFVIHPMLIDIMEAVSELHEEWSDLKSRVLKRGVRFAEIQERMIGPDGSFPPLGRSLVYRCGAFHHLALMSLREQLPENIQPSQVRGALTAVIRRTLDVPGTLDEKGWLQAGLNGIQANLGEFYISTGSLYLCTTAFLPLGLPASSEFWQDKSADWTQRKLWGMSSSEILIDKAFSE
jgi:hypothetical protein